MKNFVLGILEIPASQHQKRVCECQFFGAGWLVDWYLQNAWAENFEYFAFLHYQYINKICQRLCWFYLIWILRKKICKFWNFVSVGAHTLINFLIILCYILGVVGQQLISRVRKKCPTSSEASLKKHFSHCFSQLDSFSGASLATGLALTWTPNKNKKHSRGGIIRKLAILVQICKKEMKNFVEWANATSDFWIFNFQNVL